MRITHLGHSCLLVETADTRLLIDPGAYSEGFAELRDLDGIAVTHLHPDHIDPDRFPALARANPDARLLVESEAVGAYGIEPASVFVPGDETAVGDLRVAAVGGSHAVNHDQVAPLGNIGLVISDAEGGRLFHPGDSYDVAPADIDVLGLPLNAPWCRMKETLAFVEAVSPLVAIPIHDALLNEAGRAAYLMHVERFGPDGTAVQRLAVGASYDA